MNNGRGFLQADNAAAASNAIPILQDLEGRMTGDSVLQSNSDLG